MNKASTTIKILLITLLFLVTIGSLTIFNQIPGEDYIRLDTGNFRVFTYKYGIAVFEKGTYLFHNISPFDMTYVQKLSPFEKYLDSTKVQNKSLFTWSDKVTTIQSSYNSLIIKINHMLSYFGRSSISADFIKDNTNLRLVANLVGNDIISFKALSKAKQPVTMSFTILPDDILIDDKNIIYYQNDVEGFLKFANYIGVKNITFIKLDKNKTRIFTKRILITNPKMSGYYQIFLDNGNVEINVLEQKLLFDARRQDTGFSIKFGNYLSDFLKSNVYSN